MEDQLLLQSEEFLKTNQQTQDEIPYDENAAYHFPGGYTPVGEGVDNTIIEESPEFRVDEFQATAAINFDTPIDYYGSSSADSFVRANFNSANTINSEISLSPIREQFDVSPVLYGIPSLLETPTESNTPKEVINEVVTPVLPNIPIGETVVTPPPSEQSDTPFNPEPPSPPVPPEDPQDPQDPDPEDPQDHGKGNPGNDKEVGNSPWDGETGASDNPGKGNHQDGQDPEPNQPPGDSKNDGGQNNDSEDSPVNGGSGGKPENHQDNGWGNGDDDAPGNSGPHNNAENDQSPSGHYDDFVGRFIEQNPVDDAHHITYNWEQDNTDYLDYKPEFNPHFDHVLELPHFDNFDFHGQHFESPMH